MASMSKVIRKLDDAIDTVKAVYQDERESGETVYVALSMEELQKTLTDIRNELKSRLHAEEMKEMTQKQREEAARKAEWLKDQLVKLESAFDELTKLGWSPEEIRYKMERIIDGESQG